MRVTTELKNLIKREFANKKELVKKEYRKKNKKEYEKELANFEKTKEFQNYKKATEELIKLVDLKIEEFGGYGESTHGFYYSDFCLDLPKPNECVKSTSYLNCESEMKKIDRDMEMVLIKLAYEKDFEEVKKLLLEYGIEL